MKTSFVYQINPNQSQIDRKTRITQQERKSRENSKQGHMNPFKMKTSFLRQSLTLNTNDQNLTLNSQNQLNLQRKNISGPTGLVLQTDRKQDFMMRKIVQRFSGSPSPQNSQFHEQIINTQQSQKQRDIIRLSGRKNQHLGLSHLYKNFPHQKQNNPQNLTLSTLNQNGIQTKLQALNGSLNQQKPNRFSHQSSVQSVQSVLLDNSLADYANSVNLSSINNDSGIILKQQVQLILKRLAKNQCDIQALKRDKNLDVHLDGVWKQFSHFQNIIQSSDNKLSKIEQKMQKWNQQIQGLKKDFSKINEFNALINNQMKNIEVKVIQLNKKQQKLEVTTQNKENYNVTQISKNMKIQVQNLMKKLNFQLQSKFETKLTELKKQFKSNRKLQSYEDRFQQIYNKNGSFKISSKKCHEFITLVYKQILKVSKNAISNGNSTVQNSYLSSDRSKLLANVFNTTNNKRLPYSSPVTPQNSQISSYFLSKKQQQISQIEINQVQYFIDLQGYLLDENQYYILDGKGNQIKLDNTMIETLRKNSILKN